MEQEQHGQDKASVDDKPVATAAVVPQETKNVPSPTFKEHKIGIKWRAVFAESGFIGASILLAFALQDWDEAKDIEERTQIALCNVKSELAYNRVLIQKSYIPRQKGLAATIQATIAMQQQSANTGLPSNALQGMMVQESLRYSAWTLAGESGYLLHANFELATEIGAVIDFQEDSFQPVVNRINSAIFDSSQEYSNNQFESHVKLSSLVNEWISKTNYLEQKYESIFAREDFIQMQCE